MGAALEFSGLNDCCKSPITTMHLTDNICRCGVIPGSEPGQTDYRLAAVERACPQGERIKVCLILQQHFVLEFLMPSMPSFRVRLPSYAVSLQVVFHNCDGVVPG